MALKPWYKVVTPREDLRSGKPLDASEFAVHLDKVREGIAPDDYQNPERFFERTYLTKNLKGVAAEVIRRLSGERTETSAIFNLATQFGGGKTHTLTLLYHLAKHGPEALNWRGVKFLVEQAGVPTIPQAAVAVFVGTEFDSLTGRGGTDGTPERKTPWGEIAYQLGGPEALSLLEAHERERMAPAGDVIRKILPIDRPCIILMDELMNYVSRNRKSGLATQLYDFVQNLSETVRGMDRAVLAVSIPSSDVYEVNPEDRADFERFKKVLDRLGKAVILSAETETTEIIRRRLFEWGGIPDDGKKTAMEYADWIVDHRQQLPNWFPIDNAREAFEATYPFHPRLFSVFQDKWQSLPRFQQTRGILRLLALWVSRAYHDGYKGAHRDALIGLGTAPLDDPMFRAALFEQLGESKLEVSVATDIVGKKDSHALRLDKEAVETIKKARLHQKSATAIFFESNGGQAKADATVPEVRLDVGEPEMDIGNVETVLDTLSSSCYYMTVERNRYRFSLSPNLNKLLADRRASIQPAKIEERVKSEIQKIFAAGPSVDRIFFPERSNQIPDRPCLTLVIMSPDCSMLEKQTLKAIEAMTRESGNSSRTFKSALTWCVSDTSSSISDDARNLLAWEDIEDEQQELRLDDSQKRQLAENLKKSQRDLRESIWRSYKNLVLLDKNNSMRVVDLGLVHSSAADSIVTLILNRLRQDGDVEKAVSPNFLVRNWPPAFTEWSTKSVRDAFFASPLFPRLLNPEAVKETIQRGVESGALAYVGKSDNGRYEPFYFGKSLGMSDIEISDEMFIITKDAAEGYLSQPKESPTSVKAGREGTETPGTVEPPTEGTVPSKTAVLPHVKQTVVEPAAAIKKMAWEGELPSQKWMNFYTKFLSKFAGGKGMKLTVKMEVSQELGISSQKIDEAKAALQELGLNDDLDIL